MSAMLDELRRELQLRASPARARLCAGYFKTGPGQYAEGDVFIGVTVPDVRKAVRRFSSLPLSDVEELLRSETHEERLCALLMLVRRFERGGDAERRSVYRLYMRSLSHVDNWDLVDLSAPNIVGTYLLETRSSGAVLVRLAKSRNVWHRRIAILATAAFIREGRYVPTFNIARLLLEDNHDLIHKAVGWMLREVGKRVGQETEEEFLRRHYRRMPRVMLRYAVERFPRRLYYAYLGGRI